MSGGIILDAGPLVALLNAPDPHHDRVRAQWGLIDFPLLTCDAVVTEACFLARRLDCHRGHEKVLEFVRRGALDLSFPLAVEIDSVAQLAAKNRDVRTSLADACLVRMSELHRSSPDAGFRTHNLSQEPAAADSASVPQPLSPRIRLRRTKQQ